MRTSSPRSRPARAPTSRSERTTGWASSRPTASSPLELGDKASEFEEVSIQAFTQDGQVYGLPYAIENIALIRNTALAPAAPATWDDALAAARPPGRSSRSSSSRTAPRGPLHALPVPDVLRCPGLLAER
ncbi:extracellular solute-binding protein [Oerskovia sp. M15]